jgi:uncharacterized protein (TIGR03437 family)
VFLNPTGVLNAGSFAPFTAGIAPGELLTLFGVNLAPGVQVASQIPFPPILGGVQVMINGIAAPLYYVTQAQLSAIVPYGVTSGVAQIQVINNGVASNTVTMETAVTAPGVLTQSQNGLGDGDVVHLDGSLVTPSNPAQAGETVSLFLTGLGAVNPTIADGAAGPTLPLSNAASTIEVFIGGAAATVGYSGLAPQLAGLYQLNLTVPGGLTAGDNSLAIGVPDRDRKRFGRHARGGGSGIPRRSPRSAGEQAPDSPRYPTGYNPNNSTIASTSAVRTRTASRIRSGDGRSSKA